MLASLTIEPILVHIEGKVIFRIIVFGSLFQQTGIKDELFGVFFFSVLKWMMT